MYYITSKSWNVVGDLLDVTLSEYDGKQEWKQLHFQRAWSECTFDTEYAALLELRKMYPERLLTVFEETGKVMVTYGHETTFTSMKIRKEQNDG